MDVGIDEPGKHRASLGRDQKGLFEDSVLVGADPRDDPGFPQDRLTFDGLAPGAIQQPRPRDRYSRHVVLVVQPSCSQGSCG